MNNERNSKDWILVRGARENNLRNVNVDIPKGSLTVFTGLSGSGKSTLAFDTIFAEGQRRYVESLSSYARQFLGGFEKPDVDEIQGLSPAISIDQKSTSHNPRSTVGTVTEIYDYLRLLYARLGVPYCPNHHHPITSLSPAAMASAPELYISVISVRSCAPTYPAARARAANVEMIFFIIIERVYLLFFNNKSRNANLIKNVYICI